jgi:hypothetical protein
VSSIGLSRFLMEPSRDPVAITRSDWVLAASIAGLRSGSNQPYRTKGQHRGEAQNFVGDLQGALGEILLLRELRAVVFGGEIRHCLYVPGSGGSAEVSNSADVRWVHPATPLQVRDFYADDRVVENRTELRPPLDVPLEAKCHLHTAGEWGLPSKKLFAVNFGAVRDSHVKVGAPGFIPWLTRPGAPFARRGRLVPLVAALTWKVQQFQPARDTALVVKLHDFCPTAFDDERDAVIDSVGASFQLAAADELFDIANRAATHRNDAALAQLTTMAWPDVRGYLDEQIATW